jgi:hypothetical protein
MYSLVPIFVKVGAREKRTKIEWQFSQKTTAFSGTKTNAAVRFIRMLAGVRKILPTVLFPKSTARVFIGIRVGECER